MQAAGDIRGEESGVPKLAPGWDPAGCSLSPEEGFLLSRIDGHTPWAQLRQIGGLPPEEVDRCLRRWVSEGLLVVANGCEAQARPSRRRKASPQAAAEDPAGLETGLDLSEDQQRHILAFEAGLDRPYHEVLDVARDASLKDIKRAYFRLSKEFHPDRFYRREIGGFHARLERIFKRVVEAYELLSDPTTRAEIERFLDAPPESPPTAAATPQEKGAKSRKREALERLRKHFRIPEAILMERRSRAREFFQAAMVAGKRGQWLEAGASVRLAIAFDPWNPDYKSGFAEVQAQVHQMRATRLLEDANTSLDANAQQEAMRLYEEALSYRPGDPQLNARAADLALELGDLDHALEYADVACERAPEVVAHRLIRGRVMRRQGMADKARAEFEEALRIDPECATARAQLDALQKSRKSGGTR